MTNSNVPWGRPSHLHAMPHTLSISKCRCGDKNCRDFHLNNFGKFVQGSGFTADEVEHLQRAFDALYEKESANDPRRS